MACSDLRFCAFRCSLDSISQDGELSELALDDDAARLQKRRRLDRPPPAELEKYARVAMKAFFFFALSLSY